MPPISSKSGGKIRAVGHFYLTNCNDEDFNNRAILMLSFNIKHVSHQCQKRNSQLFTTMQTSHLHLRHTQGNGTSTTQPNSRHHQQHRCTGAHNRYDDTKVIQIKRPTVQLVKLPQPPAPMGACRNSIFGVFGIFLAKKSFQSSKFSEGIFFTWPLFSHFVMGAG